MLCWPLHLSSFRLSCADVWSKGRLEDDTFPTSQQKIEKILYSYNLLTYNMLNVTSKHRLTLLFTLQHRRRIKTEEKAKGADSVWGEEFIQFLAALAISSWLWRKGLIHPFLLTNPGAIHPIIQIVQCKTASAARNWIKLFPPNRSDDLCLFFCLYPSSKFCRSLVHTGYLLSAWKLICWPTVQGYNYRIYIVHSVQPRKKFWLMPSQS